MKNCNHEFADILKKDNTYDPLRRYCVKCGVIQETNPYTDKKSIVSEKEKTFSILDIIKKINWKDVKRSLNYLYPDDKNNYEQLFYDLQKIKKQKQKSDGESIKINAFKISEYALKQKDPIQYMIENEDYYHVETNKYSLSFRPWKEVVNLAISEDTLNHYRFPEIIAHLIWEITYYGNEKEMKKTKKEIFGRVKEVIKKHKLK